MASAIKFIHASDFHLDRPISGLAEIPSHLKSHLANAPYLAAERVFELALTERVDFVLLAGDIVDLQAGGPRAAAFLLGHFERLADKNIAVYWCGGQADHPDRWPSSIELPDNVTVFPAAIVEQVEHLRGGKAIATICGSGFETRKRNPSDFRCAEGSPFPIALCHGQFDTTSLAAQNIRYWALGGIHNRKVLEKTGTLAVYPGTSQSRSPSESGALGCTMVRVDGTGQIKAQLFDSDVVRWTEQKLTVAESTTIEDLKKILGDRCLKIHNESPDTTTLVKWQIQTTGEFNPDLRSTTWQTALVDWLRSEIGQDTDGVWTVEINIDAPKSLPASWYEEETILGDYLRAVGRYQGDTSLGLNLQNYVSGQSSDETIADLSHIPADAREGVLKRSALLGIEFLARHDEIVHDAS